MVIVGLLAAGCVALTLAAAQGLGGAPFIVGLAALLCGVSAVGIYFGSVVGGVGSAPCPSCGESIKGLERRGRIEGVLCRGCSKFIEGKSGKIWLSNPDAIADEAIFGAALPAGFEWPPGCVVCGAPDSELIPCHLVDVERDVGLVAGVVMLGALGAGVLPTGKREKIYVPHCKDHDDGAVYASGGPTGYVILFRSHAYQQAFCEVNRAAPVGR